MRPNRGDGSVARRLPSASLQTGRLAAVVEKQGQRGESRCQVPTALLGALPAGRSELPCLPPEGPRVSQETDFI